MLKIRMTERRAESALLATTALALTSALLHLGSPFPPDWANLWHTMTVLPWGGPLWLLLQTALSLAAAAF